jgi:hypothetical protein
MKFPINLQRGFVELLIVFPIFLGLALGIGLVGWLLIENTKIEKMAWHEQTKQTFNLNSNSLDNYEVTQDTSWNHQGININTYVATIPLSFRESLLENPSKAQKLIYHQKTPFILGHEPDLLLTSEFHIPGSSFHQSDWTRNKLLQEAMQKSGFGLLYPIDILGYREIAIAAGLPLDLLPEWVTEILNHLPIE